MKSAENVVGSGKLEPVILNIATLELQRKKIQIPLIAREPEANQLPKNFFQEIPDVLWRGSWPATHVAGIVRDFHIGRIISLYSASDHQENLWLPSLKTEVENNGVQHIVVDIKDNPNIFNAANSHFDPNVRTYVHCRAGANRTGLFCFVTNLLMEKFKNKQVSETTLVSILTSLLRGGYDYDQEKYLLYLNEIASICIDEGLITRDLFS